jgi:hypothetical protein
VASFMAVDFGYVVEQNRDAQLRQLIVWRMPTLRTGLSRTACLTCKLDLI